MNSSEGIVTSVKYGQERRKEREKEKIFGGNDRWFLVSFKAAGSIYFKSHKEKKYNTKYMEPACRAYVFEKYDCEMKNCYVIKLEGQQGQVQIL